MIFILNLIFQKLVSNFPYKMFTISNFFNSFYQLKELLKNLFLWKTTTKLGSTITLVDRASFQQQNTIFPYTHYNACPSHHSNHCSNALLTNYSYLLFGFHKCWRMSMTAIFSLWRNSMILLFFIYPFMLNIILYDNHLTAVCKKAKISWNIGVKVQPLQAYHQYQHVM